MQNRGYRAVPYKEKAWHWREWRINYAEVGHGPAVLLVHGFGGNCHHYRKLAADLSETYRGKPGLQSAYNLEDLASTCSIGVYGDDI